MRKFRWPWRGGTLDAAGKEIVRTQLFQVDFELKQIMTDVARVSVMSPRRSGAAPALKLFSTKDSGD